MDETEAATEAMTIKEEEETTSKEETSTTNNDESPSKKSATTEAETNLRRCSLSGIPFYKVVVTGGPCGGKTTGLARLYSYLNERGFEVMSCPETYSLLSNNGMSSGFYSVEGMATVIQDAVLNIQQSNEDAIERVLRARGKPAVMICDRGIMDGAAYITKEVWTDILARNGFGHDSELRDKRYHAVFHMVTAALGAENHYTLENNAARTETKDQARALDKITQDCWLGHPHLYVFDNSTNFEQKMSRMIDVMAKIVGLPSNLKRRSAKFLLSKKPNMAFFAANNIDYHLFHVEKVYLSTTTTATDNDDDNNNQNNNQNYSFIRKRTVVHYYETSDQMLLESSGGAAGSSVYQVTNVEFAKDGEMIEQKRIITEREYASAYMTRDHNRHIVHQKRISFIWNMQSFCIHSYEKPLNDLHILHAQVEAKNSTTNNKNNDNNKTENEDVHVDLPPFLDVERRIYNNKDDEEKYGAYSISVI